MCIRDRNYTVDLIERCKNSLERLYTCRENLDFALSKTEFGTDETLKEKAEEAKKKFLSLIHISVVAEMVERQYVDDERYARTRAHGLLVARKSRRAAARDLRQKGLDAQQISAALEEVYAPDEAGGDPELETAAALVEGRYRGKLAAGRKDLVVAALARRGFAYPIIKEAIKRVEEEN